MLIGLTGKAGAGKDTVAHYLWHAYNFRQLALADPIRRGLVAMLDLPDDAFSPANKERNIPWLWESPRALMQTLGTEWGRNLIRDDIWIRIADRAVTRLGIENPLSHTVISDIRMPNEAYWIRRRGGRLWHINRDDAAKVRPHISEAGLEIRPGDVVINNDGTLDQLHASVRSIITTSHETLLCRHTVIKL